MTIAGTPVGTATHSQGEDAPSRSVDPECWAAVGESIYQGLREFERERAIQPTHVRRRNGHPVVEPEILIVYESMYPGATERIMELAEKAQRQRHTGQEMKYSRC